MAEKLKLAKGGKLSLRKNNGSDLKRATVSLYWDCPDDNRKWDLDATALQVGESSAKQYENLGRSIGSEYVCYYGVPETEGIVSSGDDQNGGDKDGAPNEQLTIDFGKLQRNCTRIPVVITIHEAAQRGETFAEVQNARVELRDEDDNLLVTADLTDLEAGSTAAVFVVFSKNAETGKWMFENISRGFRKDLLDMLTLFGVDAEY